MKIKTMLSTGSVALALCLLPTAFSQVNNPHAGLSPAAADVARLAQSGNTDELLLSYVQKSQTPFNLSAEDVNNLRNAGVSSQVVTAMLNHDKSLPTGASQSGSDQRLYQPAGAAVKPAPAMAAPAATPAPVSQQHAAMTATPQAPPASATPAAAMPAASQAQPAAKLQTMTLTAAAPAQQSSIERAPAAKPGAKPGDSRKAFMPEESNTHVYYPKSGRQAAEAYALPPMQQLGPGYDNPVSRSPRDIGRPGSGK